MGKSQTISAPCGCWREKGRIYRYFAMMTICILGLGGFVCFDSVGSLQEAVMEHLELSASEFALTYSVNSWPNIVLCFFGGFLIDRLFGIKLATIIYSIIFAVGHFIFSLGVLLGTFWLAIVGRFIFGIGMEVMFICLQCYIIIWFKGKELSMVVCLMVSISRLGTSIMYEIAGPLYSSLITKVSGKQAVGIVFFIVGITTFVSIGCSIILKYMDPNKSDTPVDGEMPASEVKKEEKKVTFKDILLFPWTFWIIVMAYAVFVTAIFVLVPFSQGFFMTHFDLSVESANNVTSFFSILGAVIAPFLGIVVDRLGRTVYFLIGGMCNILLAHLILTLAPTSPYVGMFFMSVGFALLTSSMSPMLSFIIPEYQLGTAFGVNMALVNVAYAINLLVAGTLVDLYSFISLELYMISWCLLGVVTSIMLWIQDKRTTGILNMSPAERKEFEDSEVKKDEAEEPLKIDER